MSALTLVLSFDRDRWHASGNGVDAAHSDLRGLESLIEARLAGEAPVDVHLTFDMASLPRWLHQYHGHYCNYTLHVRPRSGRA
jgi:Family of unknown function (DUF5395)